MALSTGTRALLGEAVSWIAVAAFIAIAAAHYPEIRDFAMQTSSHEAAEHAKSSTHSGTDQLGYVELRADTQGHYNSDIEVNGRTIHAMVDTGATMVALSYEDAERAGIFLSPADFTHRVRTANGIARVASVNLERVSIGPIEVRNVRAAVSERGRLSGTLLGMSFLGRLSRLEMRDGTLILQD